MRKWLIPALVAALFLVACSNDGGGGEGSDDPKATLVAAFEELGRAEAQAITIALSSDPGSLARVSDGNVTEEQAEVILQSSITLEGTKADDPVDRRSRVLIAVEGTEGVEIVSVGADAYVRADVEGFTSEFGIDDSGIRDFAAAAEAQGIDVVQPLLDGEFIKLEGAEDLGAQLGGQEGDTSQQEQLIEQFREAIEKEATVTSEGTDEVGEHLVASVPLRQLYRQLLAIAGQSGQGLPPGMVPPAEDVPEGDLRLDAWVADGKIAQLEFDLTQIGDFVAQDGEDNPFEGVERMAIRITFSDDVAEISAPDAAAEVTAQELQTLIGSLIFGGAPGAPGDGGGGMPGGETGLDCSIYEDLPPETFEGLPQETLEQLEAICPDVVPN